MSKYIDTVAASCSSNFPRSNMELKKQFQSALTTNRLRGSIGRPLTPLSVILNHLALIDYDHFDDIEVRIFLKESMTAINRGLLIGQGDTPID